MTAPIAKQTADLKLQIQGCTNVIASTKSTDELVDAYAARGNAYVAQKNTESAAFDFTTVIKLDPTKMIAALGMRASAYPAEEDWSVALDDLNAALKLAPKDASLYALRSTAYRQGGDTVKADADCTQAHDLDAKASC